MSYQGKSSQYKGVAKVKSMGTIMWVARCNVDGLNYMTKHKTEREAAVAYDKMLITRHKEPVNILKRK